MADVTLIDPITLKRVPNHDAKRRQKELDEALARINQNNQVGQPGNEPTPHAPVSVDGGQSIDPATALAPTTIDLPTPPTPTLLVVEPPPAPAPAAPVITAEEYAKLQKSYREASQALTPALQKGAALHKELQEERESTKAELKSLRETLAMLTDLVKQGNKPAPVAYEPELDNELETIDPIIADRLRRFNQTTTMKMEELERKHQAEIQAIRDQDRQRQETINANQSALRQQNWDEIFTKLVPDYVDFLPDGSKGKTLVDWVERMPAEYSNAIINPRAHTPFFVAKVIDEFKASLAPTPTPARQPSLGDLATRALGNAPTRVETPAPERPLTDYEVKNAQSIMDKLMRDATNTKNPKDMREQKLAEANDFMSRFERLTKT